MLAKLSAGTPIIPRILKRRLSTRTTEDPAGTGKQRPDGRSLRASAQFDRTGMPARGETSGKFWQAGMNEWVLSKSIRSLLKNQRRIRIRRRWSLMLPKSPLPRTTFSQRLEKKWKFVLRPPRRIIRPCTKAVNGLYFRERGKARPRLTAGHGIGSTRRGLPLDV